MTLGELVDAIEEITGEYLRTEKTHDEKLILLVDEHREVRVTIMDGMVYTNRYRIDELHPMTFEEYLQYVRELNED